MLAENGNGTANFEDRDEDGWPVERKGKKKFIRKTTT